MKHLINQQKSNCGFWTDESGAQIPYNRTTKFERLAERKTAQLARTAVSINESLGAFKDAIREEAQELYEAFIEANGGKQKENWKGGATFFNFDRSIKIEVSVNQIIRFDENLIGLAQAKLDEVLNEGLSEAKDFVKPIVMDAFKTSNGKLDTKRVLGLRRYASKVKDPRYAEAMKFIDEAIRKPESREYYRVWIKNENGAYEDVQLNFTAL